MRARCVCVYRVMICHNANEPYVIAVIAIGECLCLCPNAPIVNSWKSYTKPISIVVCSFEFIYECIV